MKATTGQTQGKAMRRAIKVAKVITPARLLRGMAVGAMLVAGTALYFNLFPESEAGSLSSSNQVAQAVPANLGLGERKAEGISSGAAGNSTVDRTLSNIELERMDYEEGMMRHTAAHNPTASSALSKEIERLEGRIDRLLADAALDSSLNTPSLTLNREIERLDDQIDMLRLNAMQNPSAGRASSSEQIGTWPPDTEYYLNPDYRERQTAK